MVVSDDSAASTQAVPHVSDSAASLVVSDQTTLASEPAPSTAAALVVESAEVTANVPHAELPTIQSSSESEAAESESSSLVAQAEPLVAETAVKQPVQTAQPTSSATSTLLEPSLPPLRVDDAHTPAKSAVKQAAEAFADIDDLDELERFLSSMNSTGTS